MAVQVPKMSQTPQVGADGKAERKPKEKTQEEIMYETVKMDRANVLAKTRGLNKTLYKRIDGPDKDEDYQEMDAGHVSTNEVSYLYRDGIYKSTAEQANFFTLSYQKGEIKFNIDKRHFDPMSRTSWRPFTDAQIKLMYGSAMEMLALDGVTLMKVEANSPRFLKLALEEAGRLGVAVQFGEKTEKMLATLSTKEREAFYQARDALAVNEVKNEAIAGAGRPNELAKQIESLRKDEYVVDAFHEHVDPLRAKEANETDEAYQKFVEEYHKNRTSPETRAANAERYKAVWDAPGRAREADKQTLQDKKDALIKAIVDKELGPVTEDKKLEAIDKKIDEVQSQISKVKNVREVIDARHKGVNDFLKDPGMAGANYKWPDEVINRVNEQKNWYEVNVHNPGGKLSEALANTLTFGLSRKVKNFFQSKTPAEKEKIIKPKHLIENLESQFEKSKEPREKAFKSMDLLIADSERLNDIWKTELTKQRNAIGPKPANGDYTAEQKKQLEQIEKSEKKLAAAADTLKAEKEQLMKSKTEAAKIPGAIADAKSKFTPATRVAPP